MIQRKKTLNLYILLIMITYRLTIFYVGKSILIKQKRIITTTCQAKQWFFLFHFSRFFKNILHRTGSLFVKDVRFESTVLGPEYSFNSLLIISSLLFFVIRFQENFVFKICSIKRTIKKFGTYSNNNIVCISLKNKSDFSWNPSFNLKILL